MFRALPVLGFRQIYLSSKTYRCIQSNIDNLLIACHELELSSIWTYLLVKPERSSVNFHKCLSLNAPLYYRHLKLKFILPWPLSYMHLYNTDISVLSEQALLHFQIICTYKFTPQQIFTPSHPRIPLRKQKVTSPWFACFLIKGLLNAICKLWLMAGTYQSTPDFKKCT